MATETLAGALEREHREIDAGIEAYIAEPGTEGAQREPLARAIEALRRHIYLEEAFLFPPLREAGLMMPIIVMLREHGALWNAMARVASRLEHDDSSSVVSACRELLALLDQHNRKEEPIIYPQADAVLSAEANADLISFLAEGRMPEGWVCSEARPD